jgi:glycosyltransferase
MNKGIKLATGSVIGILHSDDRFADPDVLEQVMRALSDPAADAAYGDIAYVRRSDPTRVVRFWRAGSYNPLLLEIGWIPPHPSFFARKQLYTQWGSFRPDFRIAGDYELMLRLFKKAKINAVYIPRTMVYMRTGGLGERTLAAKARGWYEVFRAWRVNGWHVPLLMPFRSILHTTQLPSSLSRTHRI